jgi:hypothetical protein
MELRTLAELLMGMTFLYEFIYYIIKKDVIKTKTERIFTQIERFCISLFFLGFVFRAMHWPGGGFFYVLSLGILVFILTFRLIGNYTKNVNSKNMKRIFWILFLPNFCFFTFVFYNGLQEDLEHKETFLIIPALIFAYVTAVSTLLLVLHLTLLIIERNKTAVLNFSTHFFLLTAIILTIGIQFKTMHWPLSNLILLFGTIGFIISLGLSLSNKITEHGTTENLFAHFSTKFPILRFAFLYFAIWSIYILLVIYSVAPRIYSREYPYVYEELLDASERDKAAEVATNYEELIDEIRAKTDDESN